MGPHLMDVVVEGKRYRTATLVEVEVAAIAVHRLVGRAQVMSIGEGMLRFAGEAMRLRPEMLAVPEVRRVAAPGHGRPWGLCGRCRSR